MIIRSTERNHNFTNLVFQQLNISNLQGLTCNLNNQITAGIEAVDYESNERIQLSEIFSASQFKIKFVFTSSLNIPFFLISKRGNSFFIFETIFNTNLKFEYLYDFDELSFINWWRGIKSMPQARGLLEAVDRVENSSFDNAMRRGGTDWGGNVDGIIYRDNRIVAIIENIYTYRNPLNSPYANPAIYFHRKGPNYQSWLPLVTATRFLQIPLILMTYDGNNENIERTGISFIDNLSRNGITYANNLSPNNNIIEGLDNICDFVINNLHHNPPLIN